MSTNPRKDPEDAFSESRMSFGEHLEELRIHLWRALGGLGVAMVFSFFIGNSVLQFIARPVEIALGQFYDQRVQDELEKLNKGIGDLPPTEFVKMVFLRDQLKPNLDEGQRKDLNEHRPSYIPVPDANPPRFERDANGNLIARLPIFKKDEAGNIVKDEFGQPIVADPEGPRFETMTLWVSSEEPIRQAASLAKAQERVGRRPVLTTLSIQEAVVVYLKVCLVCGLVIGSPWIFYQVWAFIAAGLYPEEKKLVHYYLPISLILFLGGVLICEFFVMPKAVEALLWFNQWLDLEPDLRLNEWLSFAIWMPVVFGASFQTPLIMLFLERVGIVTVETYRKQRRMCYFVMLIFAAVITPSVDPFSLMLMWVPMCLLFEMGIWLCLLQPKPKDLDEPEPGEQFEG
jgi:sec-independent protein translocase protein TatC